MDFLQNLANQIKFLCDINGISVNKMLSECDAGERTYHNIKAGSAPSIDKIYKIAKYFNVSVDFLLGAKIYDQEKEMSNNALKTSEYFVAYVDILGASELMKKNDVVFLKNLKTIFEDVLYNIKTFKDFKDINVDIKARIFSDNIIFAVKKTSCDKDDFTNLYFLTVCVADFQKRCLLEHSILLRGGLSVGQLCITDNFVFGSALVRAYFLESNIAIYPRIIIDDDLLSECRWINLYDDLKYIDFDGCYFVNYLTKLTDEEKDILSNYCQRYWLDFTIDKNNNRQTDLKIKQKRLWFQNYFRDYVELNKEISQSQSKARIAANEEQSVPHIVKKKPRHT